MFVRQLSFIFVFCFCSLFAQAENARSKPYTLSVCAIFKNEAKYLKEWIEYHLLVGVDHFYLYNIDSTDQFMPVLAPYLEKKLITLVDWHDFIGEQDEANTFKWALGTQIPAYENASHFRAIRETKWLVNLDTDEFLSLSARKKHLGHA